MTDVAISMLEILALWSASSIVVALLLGASRARVQRNMGVKQR